MITIKEKALITQRKLTAIGNHKDVELWFSIIMETFKSSTGATSLHKIDKTQSRAEITVFNTNCL